MLPRVCFLLAGIWFSFCLPLLGQRSWNVQLNAGEEELQRLLENARDRQLSPTEFPQATLDQYPFLAQINRIQPLVPQRAFTAYSPELTRYFTLEGKAGATRELESLLQQGRWFEAVAATREISVDEVPIFEPNDDSLDRQWHHRYIQSFPAWELSSGSPSIRIGILDTGLDYDHPEFEGQLAINAAEDANGNGRFEPWPTTETRDGITGDFDGIDQDQNGFPDDVIGYDFTHQTRNVPGGDYLFEDPDPLDDNNHGTLVAGVVGAKADNGYGGAGLAYGCRIVVLRAFAADGTAEDDDIARAIIYGADNGIDILNFSFGDIVLSNIVLAAIEYAAAQGVVMVASAGNGTGDLPHYPSSHTGVIAVSATTADLENDLEFLWPLSSYGPTVDLAAPGSQIFTTKIRDTTLTGQVDAFQVTQGTSFSAPLVASAAALILSYRGNRTPDQIRGILTSSADDVSESGWDHFTGAGRLNVLRALQTVGNPQVVLTSPLHDSGSDQDTIYITGTVMDPEMTRFHLEYQPGIEGDDDWLPIATDLLYQRRKDTLALWDVSELPEGDYTLRLRVERSNGFTSEDRVRFVRDQSPPEISIRWLRPAWDGDQRALFCQFRSDDQATHTLMYRRVGELNFKQLTYDRYARNGELIVPQQQLPAGDYECLIRSTNLAGLSNQTEPQIISFQPAYIQRSGFTQLDHWLPQGFYLPESYDLDQDGLKEVILNEYDERLSFGRLKVYEFNGGFFRQIDSFTVRPILIPKGVADSDGDGLMELLASVNDSNFVFEQPSEGELIGEDIEYANEGNGFFAADWGDTDGDGSPEMILKDPKDYYIFDGGGQAFEEAAKLEDDSPDFSGGNAPRVLVEDFDRDGKPETIFQDADGDFLIYEHVAGNTYTQTLMDTTDLIALEGGSYLTKGDFDGDGEMEFFVAVNTNPGKRNADVEYDPPYWWLRIFEATGDNTYEMVWDEIVYDVENSRYNAATAGNLDLDPAEELVFSNFPRTYLIEYDGSDYVMGWYQIGSLATHHLIGDFDGNGVNELGLGLIDTTYFFERNVQAPGPQPVAGLTGRVLGPQSATVSWPASPTATGYELWRIRDPFNNDTALVLGPITETTWTDTDLEPDLLYLYVVRSLNPGLNPPESGFSNFVLLEPHERPRLDSLSVPGPRQLLAHFSQPIDPNADDAAYFVVDGEESPVSLIPRGDVGTQLLLNFARPWEEGAHELVVDTAFQDARRAEMNPNFRRLPFFYERSEDDGLFLIRWEILNDKQATLYFNYPLEESTALDTNQYSLSPVGKLVAVEWGSEDQDAITVTIADARLGALGYPLSIAVGDVCSINELCMTEEGNTATFSAHKDDLSEVFVYPNPARPHKLFEGVRFANLTQQATIEVFSVSGRFVNRMEETDGDGGLEWNLTDQARHRIKPGVYIYRVSTKQEGVEEFVGKFSVVE
ncbi:MAG: S8 family serine peptidase [Bacteroidota bacterium]